VGPERRDAAATAIFPGVADRDDEPGVLGNLPRSRPGRRSDKRAAGGAAAKRPAAKRRTASSGTASSSSRTPAAKRPPQPPPRPQQRPRAQAQARPSGGDPISQAVQIAGRVAAVGVKTAAGIIRRLPGR
jgi:hypothetical protein